MAHKRSGQVRLLVRADAHLNAPADAIPSTLDDLMDVPDEAAPLLREVVRSEDETASRRLHAAYALAAMAEGDAEFIINSIADARPDECPNIIRALRQCSDWLSHLEEAQRTALYREDWMTRARLALVAMHLGNCRTATDMLQETADPVQRTTFIQGFRSWHGDLAELASVVREDDHHALRSGVSLAVGGIPLDDIEEADLTAWNAVLSIWYRSCPDGGTHSSAGWALKQWSLELPVLPASNRPIPGQDWWKTPHGMTMLRIPMGFALGAGLRHPTARFREDFWLSDREVTRGLFQQFMDDEEYSEIKPEGWTPGVFGGDRNPDLPAINVNAFEAAMFCNWLSVQYGLEAYYEIEPSIDAFSVTLLGNDGFRLPSVGEWEHACRAGTSSLYFFGDDDSRLGDYAWYMTNSNSRTHPAGKKRCNGWGLFDIYGNVAEWCWDWHKTYEDAAEVEVPVVLDSGPDWMFRGGSWGSVPSQCRSVYRDPSHPDPLADFFSVGFRVAQGRPGPPSVVEE